MVWVCREAAEGLSPRLRGNRAGLRAHKTLSGSIPAPAGEPCQMAFLFGHVQVYPRACGGTIPARCWMMMGRGLSPRLRGNRPDATTDVDEPGSIPAPAGEPHYCPECGYETTVYPRACGGTVGIDAAAVAVLGLSPRLRGNPDWCLLGVGYNRSIPAPAGEPGLVPFRCWLQPVYPRACGGTICSCNDCPCPCGLSPRLRGNRLYPPSDHPRTRSIPAPAGEPIMGRKV